MGDGNNWRKKKYVMFEGNERRNVYVLRVSCHIAHIRLYVNENFINYYLRVMNGNETKIVHVFKVSCHIEYDSNRLKNGFVRLAKSCVMCF